MKLKAHNWGRLWSPAVIAQSRKWEEEEIVCWTCSSRWEARLRSEGASKWRVQTWLNGSTCAWRSLCVRIWYCNTCKVLRYKSNIFEVSSMKNTCNRGIHYWCGKFRWFQKMVKCIIEKHQIVFCMGPFFPRREIWKAVREWMLEAFFQAEGGKALYNSMNLISMEMEKLVRVNMVKGSSNRMWRIKELGQQRELLRNNIYINTSHRADWAQKSGQNHQDQKF